jgi:hypothetical protein
VAVCNSISPVTEIMPDRCTPEFERVLAKLAALLPYRRARAFLEDFFPVGDPPTIDTIQRRTIRICSSPPLDDVSRAESKVG